MNPAPDLDRLPQLLESCINLCGIAESQLDAMGEQKAAFLTTQLEDSLSQLELILRVCEDEHEDSPRREARQSLLKRLFARDEEDRAKDASEFQPPSFDVSQQGLHGHTATVPMAELLSFLSFSKKTGVLWVDSLEENFLIGMIDGQLRHVNSDHTPEGMRLGEVLVGMGYLTRRQLDRFLDKQRGTIENVTGELLLETGMISDDELQAALEHQTRNLFQRLIGVESAVFRFREGMQVALAFQVDLDVNQLLLDSARVRDEAAWQSQQIADEIAQWENWQDEVQDESAPPAGSENATAQAEDPESSDADEFEDEQDEGDIVVLEGEDRDSNTDSSSDSSSDSEHDDADRAA